jgi:SAM-dependent methyltransferase
VYNGVVSDVRRLSDGLVSAEIVDLNRRPATTPWRSALEQSASARIRGAAAWLGNLDRANWYLLLPISAEATVLEVGSGLGTVTHALALAYRRVLALEPTEERACFMHRRFAEERLANVDVIQGSLVDLPLRRESVDLAVLNGVLGWAACGALGRRARATRRRILESVRAVTRPGGLVYLGVGNRWSLRGGGVRQRVVWTSLRGYRRLLEAAGYSDIRIWCALPSHDDPQFLVAYEQRAFDHFLGALAARPRTATRKLAWRVLNSLGLLKRMTRSYCIVGRRGPEPRHAP